MAQKNDYIKLTYFNGRGRVEHVRYLFAASNVVYEDKRIGEEWKDLKPKTPLGGLPILEVGNNPAIGQSLAVGRLAAKLAKLYGSTPIEQARVDMIAETANEIREGFYNTFQSVKDKGDAEKKEAITKLIESKAAVMDALSKLVPDEPAAKCFFVGNKISWADIHFYACTEPIITLAGVTTLLDKWPKLKTICSNVEKNPGIAAYIKKRPQTSF